MNATKVKVMEGRYRDENNRLQEFADMEFILVKPWQDGKKGGFVTVPAWMLGISDKKNAQVKCKYDHVIYMDNDNNIVEIPPLEAALSTGAAAKSTALFMKTGGKVSPLVEQMQNALHPNFTPPNLNQTPEEKYLGDETDEEAMDRIADTFAMLEEITESTANGIVRGLVVSGPPGVGKSHGVVKTLEEMPQVVEFFDALKNERMKLDFQLEIIKGKSSALHLYMALYNNRYKGNVLVLDDCDGVMFDEDALNILKAALDTSNERHISWRTQSKVLEEEGIDRHFVYDGSVIFLTNLDFENTRGKIGEHLKAIMSRCHYLDLAISSRRDQMLRIKQVVRDGMLKRFGFEPEFQDEIMEYIQDNEEFLRELSLRMVVKIAEMAQAHPAHWKRFVESTCLTREARLKRLRDERISKAENNSSEEKSSDELSLNSNESILELLQNSKSLTH